MAKVKINVGSTVTSNTITLHITLMYALGTCPQSPQIMTLCNTTHGNFYYHAGKKSNTIPFSASLWSRGWAAHSGSWTHSSLFGFCELHNVKEFNLLFAQYPMRKSVFLARPQCLLLLLVSDRISQHAFGAAWYLLYCAIQSLCTLEATEPRENLMLEDAWPTPHTQTHRQTNTHTHTHTHTQIYTHTHTRRTLKINYYENIH